MNENDVLDVCLHNWLHLNCKFITETVGCVVVDSNSNLASSTSTGGLVNKMVGRIGDTSVIGAGTYANEFYAFPAIGKSKVIVCVVVARDVAATIEFKGNSLKEDVDYVVHVCLVDMSITGEVAMPYNTTSMFRACATEDEYSEVANDCSACSMEYV